MNLPILLLLTLLSSCSKEPVDQKVDKTVYYKHNEFIMGADLSYVNQILDYGGTYSDSGHSENPYDIFKKYGTNVVRLRLFHNPVWTKQVYTPPADRMYNNLSDVARAMREAKNRGMAVCLDFHYSDSWADPSKQVVPAAWADLPLTKLRDSVYNYTRKVIIYLDLLGLMPEYVQTGNEINPGFLLPYGDRWDRKSDFIYLMNAAIGAVRDASAASSVKPKIILHVAQPENAVGWFSGMSEAGMADYDIVGISYYYMWSTVPLNELGDRIKQLRSATGKDVVVVETGYPWSVSDCDSYKNIIQTGKINGSRFPATEQGQYYYLVTLTGEIFSGGGKGIIYWEPAWITSPVRDMWGTGSAWDCNTLFNCRGNTMKGFKFMTVDYSKVQAR